MTSADILLLALGAVAVGAAFRVVRTAHLVRAGLWLVVTLGAVAGAYLVLAAELVAWVQVLLYVGAVVVLLLFAVMLTRAPIGASADLDRPGWAGALVGGGAALGLGAVLSVANPKNMLLEVAGPQRSLRPASLAASRPSPTWSSRLSARSASASPWASTSPWAHARRSCSPC